MRAILLTVLYFFVAALALVKPIRAHDNSPNKGIEENELYKAISSDQKILVAKAISKKSAKGHVHEAPPLIIAVHALKGKGFKYKKNIIQLLISKGAKINEQDTDCNTPLFHAIQMNEKETAQILLSKNANINTLNRAGVSALIAAYKKDDKSLFRALLQRKPNLDISNGAETILIRATIANDIETVEQLISMGANPNQETKNKETAIMFALARNFVPLAQFFAKIPNIQLNTETSYGRTPLLFAITNGSLEAVNTLLDHGADPNFCESATTFPIIHASALGNPEIVKLLIQKGADVNLQCKDLSTALIAATKQNNEIAVEMLLDSGANVDIQDGNGMTALMHAILNKNQAIATMLLEKGANPHLRNNYGVKAAEMDDVALMTRAAKDNPDKKAK